MQSITEKPHRKMVLIVIGIIAFIAIILALYGILQLNYRTRFHSGRTHPAFSDNFIIGSSPSRIVWRYGRPYQRHYSDCGELLSIIYAVNATSRIRRPRLTADFCQFVIFFENDIAIETYFARLIG